MNNKQKFPVIEVKPSGNPDWSNGAWCLVWVYTTNGNFLLKGFVKECEDYIKEKGWKCWAVYNLYHGKVRDKISYWRQPPLEPGYRTLIKAYKCDYSIYSPHLHLIGKKRKNDYRFSIFPKEKGLKPLYLKRLPKQFVEFNFESKKIEKTEPKGNTLGDITLGSLRK